MEPPRLAYLAFGPRDEGLVWIRSDGALDAAEWDPAALAYVEGSRRDGGAAMPTGWWESGRLPGPVRRMVRVEAEREGFGPLSVVAFTERLPEGERTALLAGTRWGRLSPRVEGRTHRVRIEVGERTLGVRRLTMAFDALAGPDR